MAVSEHHQCHQHRGWGTEILSNLASWLGGGTCSPVSSSILHFPQGPAGGGTKPLCHRRWGACATASALDGRSSLRTEWRRHGGCGPARGAGWSAGGRRSPPAPRPVQRGCARSSRFRVFLSGRPARCIPTFSGNVRCRLLSLGSGLRGAGGVEAVPGGASVPDAGRLAGGAPPESERGKRVSSRAARLSPGPSGRGEGAGARPTGRVHLRGQTLLRFLRRSRKVVKMSLFLVAKRNVSAPCPQPHGIIHLFLCSKT